MPDKPKSDESQVMLVLERLDSKVEKLDLRLDSVDKTLIKQEANLDKHMFRTELAEKNIELIRDELVPIKKHVVLVENTFKVFGILCSVSLATLGAVAAVLKIMSYLNP